MPASAASEKGLQWSDWNYISARRYDLLFMRTVGQIAKPYKYWMLVRTNFRRKPRDTLIGR